MENVPHTLLASRDPRVLPSAGKNREAWVRAGSFPYFLSLLTVDPLGPGSQICVREMLPWVGVGDCGVGLHLTT